MSAIIGKIKQEIVESESWKIPANEWESIVDEVEWCTPLKLKDGSKVTTEHSWGGEGQGDSCGYVLKIERPSGEVQYLRVSGYYASWEGSDYSYDDIDLVEPYEKITVDYRIVKAG